MPGGREKRRTAVCRALVTAPALITFGSAASDLFFPDDEPALYKSAGLWYIWGESNFASLRAVIATLRKKPETEADSPQYIQTHIGVGIRMIRAEEQV